MLIHGKLILTAHGFMLDEVRSLLQKALRRKEHKLILQSCKELLAYDKDQLPWKSILTFMFEDHCMSNETALLALFACHQCGSKYDAVELLSKCNTSRTAACLPVVAIDSRYEPRHWQPHMNVDVALKGLVTPQPGTLDCDLVLGHLIRAWKEKNGDELITYIKMATIIVDQEKRHVTQKGEVYAKGVSSFRVKVHCGLIVLAALYKNTADKKLKKYVEYCFKLAATSGSPNRLILCAPVTQLLFGARARQVNDLTLGNFKWSGVNVLQEMPDWAVDKHTFRGKFGKGTRHLVKTKPKGMTEEMYEIFHGNRKQRTIKDFFDEGVVICQPSVDVNPYWNLTTSIYFRYPPKQQKTLHMTAIYYKELKLKFPSLFVCDDPKSDIVNSITIKSETDVEEDHRKRKLDDTDFDVKPVADMSSYHRVVKWQMSDEDLKVEQDEWLGATEAEDPVLDDSSEHEDINVDPEKRMGVTKTEPDDVITDGDEGPDWRMGMIETEADDVITDDMARDEGPDERMGVIQAKADDGAIDEYPLLQIPTGPHKVYSRVDLTEEVVWKGPYNHRKYGLTMFYHEVMKDVLGDVHTLTPECHKPFIVFPLLKGTQIDGEVDITKKDFYDCIGKRHVKDGQFVLRESLGIVQLHRIPLVQYQSLPATFWSHYLYRYMLNVGDSGLFNSLTDCGLTFLYGIDMEEERGKEAENNIISVMFSAKPARAVRTEVKLSITHHKDAIFQTMIREVNYAYIQRIAATHDVVFDRHRFIRRLVQVRELVSGL